MLVVKNPPANTGDLRYTDSVPGSGRSPGGEYGNPLQDSFLENPVVRGAWWATVHGVAESTQLSSPKWKEQQKLTHTVNQLYFNNINFKK